MNLSRMCWLQPAHWGISGRGGGGREMERKAASATAVPSPPQRSHPASVASKAPRWLVLVLCGVMSRRSSPRRCPSTSSFANLHQKSFAVAKPMALPCTDTHTHTRTRCFSLPHPIFQAVLPTTHFPTCLSLPPGQHPAAPGQGHSLLLPTATPVLQGPGCQGHPQVSPTGSQL